MLSSTLTGLWLPRLTALLLSTLALTALTLALTLATLLLSTLAALAALTLALAALVLAALALLHALALLLTSLTTLLALLARPNRIFIRHRNFLGFGFSSPPSKGNLSDRNSFQSACGASTVAA